MSDLRVREALLDDAAGIARVHVESWRATYRGIVPDQVLAELSYGAGEDYWRRVLTRVTDRDFVYLAEDEQARIVGFAFGGPERTGDSVYTGELHAIYLLPDYQRQGLGRCLTLAVVDRLEQLGLRSLLVWVLADNPSRRFYEALGGQSVRAQQVEIGGAQLEEVAYGWLDAPTMVRPKQTGASR
jgi:GNAT superfamily N-acetyltransferase